MDGSSPSEPAPPLGTKFSMSKPFGVYTKTMRRGAPLAAAPIAARAVRGIIASSIGRAIQAPSPRRKVRRGRAREEFVMCMGRWERRALVCHSFRRIGELSVIALAAPHLERRALHDLQHQRGKLRPIRID